jgi:Transposase
MVHVHGAQAQQLAQATRGVDPAELVAVPVDVGKHAAMALVCDFTGELLARPFEFPMTMAGVRLLVERVQAATRGRMIRLVRVGVEAAGHYHQPLVSAGVLPEQWQLVQVNPTQVASQRQLTGRRRLKTDALDLVAISDLLRAGHGAGHRVLASALGELAGWVAHRERRVTARTALKNQLLGQVDRAFPGVSGGVSSLFGTKVGRLVLAEFTDPVRLASLGVAGFQQAAAARGVQVLAPVAERLVAAATVAIPTDQAPMAEPSSTAISPCWPPSTPRSPRPTSTWPPCCHAPPSPCCVAALAGEWSGLPPMGPRSATRHGGPAPARCIGPADCAQQPTPRLAVAMTAPSAGKARSPCAGPCCRSGWGCGGWTPPPAPMPSPCGPVASRRG